MFQFDPKLLKAMEAAAEKLMKEARYRAMYNASSSPFATGGYVNGSYADEGDIDSSVDNFFKKERFKPNLTTAQKMRVFKFITALETAEEL